MKQTCFLFLLIVIFVFGGCSGGSSKPADPEEQVKNQALEISRALYSGNSEFVLGCSEERTHEYLLEVIELNKGVELKELTVLEFTETQGTCHVVIQISDTKDINYIYHDMYFESVEGNWRLMEFGIDI